MHIYACLYTHAHNLLVYIIHIHMHIYIDLNIIDILCLHIFFWIRSNSRITFIVFGGN